MAVRPLFSTCQTDKSERILTETVTAYAETVQPIGTLVQLHELTLAKQGNSVTANYQLVTLC